MNFRPAFRFGPVCLTVLVGGLVFVGGAAVRAAPVYFFVSERPGSQFHLDSYLLPLDNPADIAAARDIIKQGPGQAKSPIVFARIAPGADNINKNLYPPFQTWSWHVTEFLGFADLGAELYDGWPTYVEQDVQGWMDNTNGIIGFWSYRLVSEVVVPEPSTWALATAAMGVLALVGWRRHARRT
ncbi:MAG: PEP-CTERM sorting domain-containing protein [Pirellulales bacterium]|nr:PEP-CTERM sorting domain-containing protein [Pirellulales bacterium]